METATLDLTTMEGLNSQVGALFKALSASMTDADDKAAITVTISMKRVKDTESLMDITYKVKPTYPSRSRKIIAHADLVGNLTVDAVPTQRSVFENAGI
jgi:hypothetical protein